ncbi:MAG: hypothetical protein K2O73_04185, partial [Lachnospiraceae bacterium]|nr:hypothetical protein [Lachnospiraceae bacterium]
SLHVTSERPLRAAQNLQIACPHADGHAPRIVRTLKRHKSSQMIHRRQLKFQHKASSYPMSAGKSRKEKDDFIHGNDTGPLLAVCCLQNTEFQANC